MPETLISVNLFTLILSVDQLINLLIIFFLIKFNIFSHVKFIIIAQH